MALFDIALADSTNDGEGPSTEVVPPELNNAVGDYMVISVGISYDGSSGVPTATTPDGWTLIYSDIQVDLRHVVYGRASAGNTAWPSVILSAATEWTVASAVISDIDFVNGPYNLVVTASATGSDPQIADFTTDVNGNASAVLTFATIERRIWGGVFEDSTRPQTKFIGAVNTGTSSRIDNGHGVWTDFTVARNTNFESARLDSSGSGDYHVVQLEFITQANLVPVQLSVYPQAALPANTNEITDDYLRAMLVDKGILFDGTAAATWTFNGSTALTQDSIATISINAAGSGYVVNDLLTITGGNGDALANVEAVDGSGGVTSISLYHRGATLGTGYSTGTGVATSGGTGSGCTLDIDSLAYNIALPSHGMDESMVVHLDEGAGSAPTGLASGEFYYVKPLDENTVCLVPTNPDSDSDVDFYCDRELKKEVATITGLGSGTITLTESRCTNAPAGGLLDIYRPDNGSAVNTGPAPGSYIGDSGYHQNYLLTASRFDSVFDATGQTLYFTINWSSGARFDEGFFFAIDEDGDWARWKVYDRARHGSTIGLLSPGGLVRQFQLAQSTVVDAADYESGTFDGTRVRYIGVAIRGNNASVGRFNSASSIEQFILNDLIAVGGSSTIPATMAEVTTVIADAGGLVTQPSELQFTYTQSLQIGDGVRDTVFVDSEKSLAFPPLADGIESFENYLAVLGVTTRLTAGSTFSFQNAQIGASSPWLLDLSLTPSGAVQSIAGTTLVFATATLDADIAYNRVLFVGGRGVFDNGAQIRNSTFVINNQVRPDNGVINWTGSANIADSTFEAAEGLTDGHAIEINTPGTYSFAGLGFSGFGADGSNTAAVYNASGGAVTINVSGGGDTPTVRNSAGSSTTINAGAQLTLTGLVPNSEVRVYAAGTQTELGGVENSGTSETFSVTVPAVDVVIHNVQYEYIRITNLATTADVAIPIQQRFDRNYSNPA